MPTLSRYIQRRNIREDPIQSDGLKITPVSQILSVQCPYFHFSWHRPQAVYVDDGHQEQRFRIFDITRLIQVSIIGSGFMLISLILLSGRKR